MKMSLFWMVVIPFFLCGCTLSNKTTVNKNYYYQGQTFFVTSEDTAIEYSIQYLSFDDTYIYFNIYNYSPHIYTPQEWVNLENPPVKYDENNPSDYELYYKKYVSYNGDFFFYICLEKNVSYYYYNFEEIIINDVYKSASYDLETKTYVFFKGSFYNIESDPGLIKRVANVKIKYSLKQNFQVEFDGQIACSLVILNDEPYVGLEINLFPY